MLGRWKYHNGLLEENLNTLRRGLIRDKSLRRSTFYWSTVWALALRILFRRAFYLKQLRSENKKRQRLHLKQIMALWRSFMKASEQLTTQWRFGKRLPETPTDTFAWESPWLAIRHSKPEIGFILNIRRELKAFDNSSKNQFSWNFIFSVLK